MSSTSFVPASLHKRVREEFEDIEESPPKRQKTTSGEPSTRMTREMRSTLPPNPRPMARYTQIASIHPDSYVNIYGIVADLSVPRNTRGSGTVDFFLCK
jgi:hypothetical protein